MSEQPNRPSESRAQPINRLTSTVTQLGMLLSISENLKEYLIIPKGLDGVEVSEEVQQTVVTTLIHACSRMDAIIQDEKRWSVQDLDEVIVAMKAHYEQLTRTYRKQEEVVMQSLEPFYMLKGSVIQLPDGRWAAIFGGLHNAAVEPMFVLGATPEEAIRKFNLVFTTGKQDHVSGVQGLSTLPQVPKEELPPEPEGPPPTATRRAPRKPRK